MAATANSRINPTAPWAANTQDEPPGGAGRQAKMAAAATRTAAASTVQNAIGLLGVLGPVDRRMGEVANIPALRAAGNTFAVGNFPRGRWGCSRKRAGVVFSVNEKPGAGLHRHRVFEGLSGKLLCRGGRDGVLGEGFGD